MKTELISVGPYEVNCALVWGPAQKALVIDPGFDAEEIRAALERNQLEVAAYLLTHGHADHIHALNELHGERPAPIYLHRADEAWAFGPDNQIPPYYDVPARPTGEWIHPESAPEWTLADLNIRCIETPGHTPGCVCYWFEEANLCFTGDTLFNGSCGRTDLPGGDARALMASLGKLVDTLPKKTRIIAGHGASSTIANELEHNYFLRTFNR